ncbi:fimbrial protein [Pseudomonas wadenswilerensis]|uniref:P pilus assembly protein, pilin FimA n=2 Tax=Pseudomonas wadenswilerensis TaxID=1785161 RepID=A0A380T0H7_9PSED|nr:P pilus assembly protein, pilin FimA [Pseudomonas wadenswilerensis]
MAANCTFTFSDKHNKETTVNFGAGLTADSLTIPQDAPIGTIVYQQSLNSAEHVFTCAAATRYGFAMNPALGIPVDSTYPLGKSGLSFRVGTPNPNISYMPPPFNVGAGTYTTNGGNYTLEVFKSGDLSATNEIPAGFLGNLQVTDLVFIKFNTALNQCQRGIKKVTYQLKATTRVIDAKNGVVALNGESTAKGIGLQLMNDSGQPIALDTSYPFNGFDPLGTDFKIPLAAAYYRLAEDHLEAGSANTAVTFIMSYL